MATWWQILGYESADEADKELASGAISSAELQRAKDEAFQQSSETTAPATSNADYWQQYAERQKAIYESTQGAGEEVTEVITEPTEEGGDTLYIVVGSPPNYTIAAVNPGDANYSSGMTQQAAQDTANTLNANYQPPSSNDDTVTDDWRE